MFISEDSLIFIKEKETSKSVLSEFYITKMALILVYWGYWSFICHFFQDVGGDDSPVSYYLFLPLNSTDLNETEHHPSYDRRTDTQLNIWPVPYSYLGWNLERHPSCVARHGQVYLPAPIILHLKTEKRSSNLKARCGQEHVTLILSGYILRYSLWLPAGKPSD